MVTPIPQEHIQDAHKLTADGRLDLFALTPATGGGTLHFKADNDLTWRGELYHGLPLIFSSNGTTAEKPSDMPKLIIGEENTDLSLFKPLINDGHLEGCIILRYHVLLQNALDDSSLYELYTYRCKRVEGYNRASVSMQLASLSDSLNFALPVRQYLPPEFPTVQI
jgi:phage-related protein